MHEHEHELHRHGEEPTPEELTALLKYLVKHNTEHTAELTHLAAHLPEGNEAKALVTAAAEDYARGNEKLAAALTKLNGAE